MQPPATESQMDQKWHNSVTGVLVAILFLPVLLLAGCFIIPYIFILGWIRQIREFRFHRRMQVQGRLIGWQEFLRNMRGVGGTCIEEKFSAKGPIRFWWTPDNVLRESPHAIIDWFTMRKGGRFAPFIYWCRDRYTNAYRGSATLVETAGVPRREIYRLWSSCRSEESIAKWIEVAPPEILSEKQPEVPSVKHDDQ